MKATSKLISVVLVLAMCLSLFAASAFADGGVIIIPSDSDDSGSFVGSESGNVYGSSYDGESGSGVSAQSAVPSAANSGSGAVTLVNAGTGYASLADALAAAASGETVKLNQNVSVNGTLNINGNVTVDLNGYTLSFSNGGAAAEAAILVNGGSVTVKNGLISASGKAAEGEGSSDTGYHAVAKTAGGSLAMAGVGVTFNAPESWSMFNGNVTLRYGSYNRDVSAFADPAFELAEGQDGRVKLVEKPAQAEEPAQEPAEEVTEPAAEAEEPAAETQEQIEEAQEPAEETQEPAEETQEPAEETQEPAEETQEPVEEAQEPAEETEEPAEETQEPVEEAQEPAEETEEPAEETQEPVEEAQEPAEETQEPAEEPQEAEGDALPASDEEQDAENPEELPVDETPVEVKEEEPLKPDEEVNEVEGEAEEPTISSENGVVSLKGLLAENMTVTAEAAEVEAPEEEELLGAYNITLRNAEGEEVQPENALLVTVTDETIRAAIEEGFEIKVYHVTDEGMEPVTVSSVANGAVSFVAKSFSVYAVTCTDQVTEETEPEEEEGTEAALWNANSIKQIFQLDPFTPETGELHNTKVSVIPMNEIVDQTGEDAVFAIKGVLPYAVSLMEPDEATSGSTAVYTGGLLISDRSGGAPVEYKVDGAVPAGYTHSVEIDNSLIATLRPGRWAVVFWYQDTKNGETKPVFIVQYFTIVESLNIEAIGAGKNGILEAEKCDGNAFQFLVPADEITGLQINFGPTNPYDPGGTVVLYPGATNPNKVDVLRMDWYGDPNNVKNPGYDAYNPSSCFSITDYVTTDAYGHSFVAGKILTLSSYLIQRLAFWEPYGDYEIEITGQKYAPDGSMIPVSNAGSPITIHLTPGITVADGLNDYIKGKNVWIKFKLCSYIDYEPDGSLAIWIGGQKISKDYYSYFPEKLELYIYRNLLDQLRSNNSYTLTARLARMEPDPYLGKTVKATYYPATASFNILAAGSTSYKSPKTGDNANIGLWAAVLVVSGGAVVALLPKKRKNR